MEVIIVTHIPVDLSICSHCVYVGRSIGVRLTEPTAPVGESGELSNLVSALVRRGVHVVVVDAFTLRGLWLMLRHKSGKLPLVIAGGKLIHSGPLGGKLEKLVNTLVTLTVSKVS